MATIQNGFSFLGELHHQQYKYPILAQPYNLQRELPKYFLNPIEITDQVLLLLTKIKIYLVFSLLILIEFCIRT